MPISTIVTFITEIGVLLGFVVGIIVFFKKFSTLLFLL